MEVLVIAPPLCNFTHNHCTSKNVLYDDWHSLTFPIQSVAHPQCMGSPFFWWSYGKNDGHERCVNGKISNDLEAKMAASYCYWLHSEGFTHKHVAILSPYRAQVSSIYCPKYKLYFVEA